MFYLVDGGRPYLVCAECAEQLGAEIPPRFLPVHITDCEGACELCEVAWGLPAPAADGIPVRVAADVT